MKKVCVLLSAYNGEKFLREQLNSLAAQKGVEMRLYVRDDGSKDGTAEILREYRERGVIDCILPNDEGNLGFADSFYRLVEGADPDCDYYAFCDQDDIWDEDKLLIAASRLDGLSPEEPSLYFGSYRVIDANGKLLRKCGLKIKYFPEYAFEELFSMNHTYGCTCVFNAAARKKYLEYEMGEIRFHDWTINVICAGISGGGYTVFDPIPHMSYRLHANNCFGPAALNRKSIQKFIRYCKEYEFNNTRLKEMELFRKHFYSELSEERKVFVDLVCGYRKDKKSKKALLRYKPYFHKGKSFWLKKLNRYQIRKGKL